MKKYVLCLLIPFFNIDSFAQENMNDNLSHIKNPCLSSISLNDFKLMNTSNISSIYNTDIQNYIKKTNHLCLEKDKTVSILYNNKLITLGKI